MLNASKLKFWSACQLGDAELFDVTLQNLLEEVGKSENVQNSSEDQPNSGFVPINEDDITKLVNDTNEEGNTLLHLAAAGNFTKLVW